MTFAPDVAIRFSERVEEVLPALCQEAAERIQGIGLRFTPAFQDEEGSLYFARPVYSLLVTTGKQRTKRSATGTWRFLYDLADTDGDNQPDTLRLLSIRHAGSRPLALDESDDQE